MRSTLLLFFIASLSYDVKTQFLESGSNCNTPNREKGKCIPLNACSVLYNALGTENENVKKFIRSSLCGWESEIMPRVCCGTKASYSVVVTESKINVKKDLLPNRTLCGFQEDTDKILGGINTGLVEFPWVALLGYTDIYKRESFGCGGALISNRYVLTAAHCIKVSRKLTKVRLGEWNLNTTDDCVGSAPYRYCIQAQDFEVDSTISHENYNYDPLRGLTYDIALIRLKEPVTFSRSIQPICLPTQTENSGVNTRLLVSGWGVTDIENYKKTEIKQKLDVPVVDTSECRRKYGTRGNITINDEHLCAGGELGKDACKGDSGGPLMSTVKGNSLQFYVEGLVSYGISCGKEFPGVYTRVSKYLDWIEQNIRE